MTTPTPARAGEDAGREATPKQMAAAWAAWRVRHPTLRLGPGPGFAEAITAALNAEPSAAEVEVARLTQERDRAEQNETFTASRSAEIERHYGVSQSTVSALRERVARLEEENGAWKRVAVIAAVPLEAMRMAGSYRMLAPSTQTMVDEAVVTIRMAVSGHSLPPYGDMDAGLAPARAALTEGAPTDV